MTGSVVEQRQQSLSYGRIIATQRHKLRRRGRGSTRGYDSGSIVSVKLSVSIDEHHLDFLDRYAAARGVSSRSAVVQRAIDLLRANELGSDYAAAWDEWAASEVGWDATTADGLTATRQVPR